MENTKPLLENVRRELLEESQDPEVPTREEIESTLSKVGVPHYEIKDYTILGEEYYGIFLASSNHKINNVAKQYPESVSLSLNKKTNELHPQIFGGSGGQCIYVRPDKENPREKYLAMVSVRIPFVRLKKHDKESTLKKIELFAKNWKKKIAENEDRLFDYPR